MEGQQRKQIHELLFHALQSVLIQPWWGRRVPSSIIVAIIQRIHVMLYLFFFMEMLPLQGRV
eukprot:211011-Ditylum_brightwellii.AAC.1